jgi:hypothetical protein
MTYLRQKSFQGIVLQQTFQLVMTGILTVLLTLHFTTLAQSSTPMQEEKQSPAVKQESVKEAPETPCTFIDASLAFAGTPLEQAKCLLRPVSRHGKLGEPLKQLPEPLEELIGKSIVFDKETLRSFLQQQKIKEKDIGGSLDEVVSRASDNNPSAPLAQYFVIHDVSTPNYLNQPFPVNINEKS